MNLYTNPIWAGVAEKAKEQDVNTLVFISRRQTQSAEYSATGNLIYQFANQHNIEGLIILSAGIGYRVSHEAITAFCHQFFPLPIISVGEQVENVVNLLVDNQQGIRDLMAHLIDEHGRQRIAFLQGPANNPEAQERFQTYKQVLENRNIPLNPELIVDGGFFYQHGQIAAQELMQRGVKFDAIISANDASARGAIDALQAQGIHIPGDISVTGFDDIASSQHALPPLTTVRQPLKKLGEKAFELIFAILQDEEVPPETTLGTQLVVRQSCGCLPSNVKQILIQPAVSLNRDDGDSLPPQKETLLEDWLQAFAPILPESPSWQEEWIPEVLAACFDETIGGKPGAFLQTLNIVIQQSVVQHQKLDLWHEVLTELRCQVGPYLQTVDKIRQVESLWQQARILISNLLQQTQARSQLRADFQTSLLFEINDEVITTFDLPKLMNALSASLKQLEISFGFLCLNDTAITIGLEKLPTQSRLIMAYQDGEQRQLQPGGIPFPTEKLLPDEILTKQHRWDALLLSLRFQDHYLGHALFEMGNRDGFIYDALQSQISSAVRGADLIEQLSQARADLEYRVEERTAELEKEIAERERVEATLRENERRYRILFEQINDAVFILNFDQTVLMANQKAADLLGYKLEEMAGLSANDIVAADEIPDANKKLQIAMTGKFLPTYERNLIRKDGSLVPVEINLSQVSDLNGKPLHVQSVARDITERKRSDRITQAFNRASLAMRQAITPEEIFDAVGEELKKLGLGCTIFRTNHDLSQMYPKYFNYESKIVSALEKTLNLRTESFAISIEAVDVFKRTVWERETVFSDVGQSIRRVLPQHMKSAVDHLISVLNVPLAINAPLIVDEQLMGMFSIQSDELTEDDIATVTTFAHQIASTWQKARLMQDLELSLVAQLQAEESLRESEEKYRTLFDLSPEAIVVIGLNGIVLDANKAATRFGDVTKEDIVGRSFLDLGLFDESRSQYFLDLFSQSIIGDISGPLEFQLDLGNNALHWVEAHPALLRDGDDVVALQLILRDITDRREAEQAIQQRVAELEMIHQTSLKLATASLSVNEVAEIAVQQLGSVMASDTCAFAMLNLHDRELAVVAENSCEGNERKLLRQGEVISFDDYPVIDQAINTTIPRCIISTDLAATPTEIAYLRKSEITTLVIIPFSIKSRIIGLMEIGIVDERHYPDSQLNLAMTLANQIAVALDNARLFEAAQQELFDRIQAEMALQESEEQFRSIFENAVMGFYRSTPSGQILMANPALIRMLGYESFEELSEQNFEINGFGEEASRSEFMHQMRLRGQVIGLESTWLRKDNTPLYVQESAKAIYDGNGKVTFYEGTVEDITQRKAIEALQHISEERFNKAFNISPLAMGIQGMKGEQWDVWLLINDAFSQITGYSRAEVVGHTTNELDLYANPEEYEKAVNLFFDQGYIREFEFEFRRKSGERRHGLLWSEATQVGDERNVLVLIQDVTDRKTAERERQTLIEFQQLVAMLSARFINLSTVEIEEEITYALKIIAEYAQADAGSVWMFSDDKSMGSKTFGWPHLGKRSRNQNVLLAKYSWMFDQLLAGKMISISNKVDSPLESVGQTFDDFDLSALLAIPLITEGEVIGSLSIYMHAGEKQWSDELESLLKIIGDIIVNALERKRAEESIHQLNEELELRVIQRTQQLEAANIELEAFAYSVSHDLRAPLRAIDGFSLALMEDYKAQLDDNAQNYLRRVRAASQRMGQLIDDLLKLSRVTRSEMDHNKVDLSAMFSEIIAELREAEPKQEVEIIVQPDLMTLGDKHLLQIMLTNLCSNAWKFTRKKEQVRIEFGRLNSEEVQVFFIRDNGAGFDMNYADKLFGTFQRLHTIRDFEGTGIGLATVKRIIQRHGGRVWAEGAVDQGATFYFTIGEIP